MKFLLIFSSFIFSNIAGNNEIRFQDIEVFGPGLTSPDTVVMPARYFFIFFRGRNYTGNETINENDLKVVINGTYENRGCRLWPQILNRKDSTVIVRYKLYEPCYNFQINLLYKGYHIAKSPYYVKGPVLPDDCYCPDEDMESWLHKYGCKSSYEQMVFDLSRFGKVNFGSFYDKAIKRFNNSYSSSICHYVIKSNQVYRNCYGQHVAFKMFTDSLLLSLTRKVHLPDMEFFTNLGDWPLMKKDSTDIFPIFSWCGSKDTFDIVMPTYEITEASLEMMGRVSLDMLSVQANIEKKWEEKEDKCFWRGRDSSAERLKLIEISRKHPDLFNASLTNFFFYKEQEKTHGPKTPHISFFKFFNYKYQVCLDGTVAAYRLPYLLAGDSLVFKQTSQYYEHFYNKLAPGVHYVPVKTDLSDLVERINEAKKNEERARAIARNGREFVLKNLLPQDIICYHAKLLFEWSRKLSSEVFVRNNMSEVNDNYGKSCVCPRTNRRYPEEL